MIKGDTGFKYNEYGRVRNYRNFTVRLYDHQRLEIQRLRREYNESIVKLINENVDKLEELEREGRLEYELAKMKIVAINSVSDYYRLRLSRSNYRRLERMSKRNKTSISELIRLLFSLFD